MSRLTIPILVLLLVLPSASGCASTLHGVGDAWRRNQCSKQPGRSDRERCGAPLVGAPVAR